MSVPDLIATPQLLRLTGTPEAPLILDVRERDDFDADPRMLPASYRRDHHTVGTWAGDYAGKSVAVVCQRGLKVSQGVAAWLRYAGAKAEALEGGFEAWVQSSGLLLRTVHVPPRDEQGRTVWITRGRPKIDRIACPWLIRRFVDPSAVFLFVAPSEVEAAAERFGATPFDIEGVFWSHRGDACTFDVMLEAFGLRSDILQRLAMIVRGADTARPDLAPEAAGLLAISLGLSRMYRNDLLQLDAAMLVYDALYRWARDAKGETHNWPATGGART